MTFFSAHHHAESARKVAKLFVYPPLIKTNAKCFQIPVANIIRNRKRSVNVKVHAVTTVVGTNRIGVHAVTVVVSECAPVKFTV